MKKIHLCVLFSLAVLAAASQKVYFVYIQADTDQPFFVKMNGKLNPSTSSGYIILSKLHDSTYNFSVGFPQNKWPEQNFSVAVNRMDHGYLLKNFGEKGWGLFDLQTMAVQMAITGNAGIEPRPMMDGKDVSPFTEQLSKAADDPSLKEKPLVTKTEEKKTDTLVQEVAKKEETAPEIIIPVAATTDTPGDKPAGKKKGTKSKKGKTGSEQAVVTEEPVEKKDEITTDLKEPAGSKPVEVTEVPAVKKEEPKPEKKDSIAVKPEEIKEQPAEKKEDTVITEVKEQAVTKPAETVTQPEKKNETVTAAQEQPLVAAADSKAPVADSYKASQVKKWAETATTEGLGLVYIDDNSDGIRDTIRLVIPNPKPVVALAKDEPKEEKKFLDITTEASKKEESTVVPEEKTTAVKPVDEESPAEKKVYKNKCKEVASESDFLKRRKKMAAAENDDDMISEAKKYFKGKCFNAGQLKNLSTLFLTDEGKYSFFEASYKYVADLEAFNALQSELKDDYYAGRFKAMLHN